MRKKYKILGVILACAMLFSLCACGDNSGTNTLREQTYTIQYTDNTGVHSIEVQSGKLYSISAIPEKYGYEFMGLYDAEVGGTQYVNAGGSAVAAFTDNKNIVLYPQFRAKEFTLILDYQGAAVTGSRSMKVSYNSEISELPLNLTLENKNFVGWYTEPNRKGNQIADQYGVLPENRKVTEKLFDLSDPDGNIKLYAGFKGEEFTVTFYFTDSGVPEEVLVEYGTPISEVQLETRVDGKAVLVWSKKRNDTNKEQAFTGKVTSEMVLYAAEFAPVIDFDSNGGNNINSIIARAGDAINLPTPVRENYKFVGWQTTSGSTFSVTTMPTSSVKLTAKWQAIIIFDTNGGTEVANISEPQGTSITLPETEKAGYMFAGWYDGNGEQYIYTIMPQESLRLLAKYYKVLTKQVVIIDSLTSKGGWKNVSTAPSMDQSRDNLDLSDLYNIGVRMINVTVSYYSYAKNGMSSRQQKTLMAWFSAEQASNAYLIWSYEEAHSDNKWHSYTRKQTLELNAPILYICRYCSDTGIYRDLNGDLWYSDYYWKDFYVEIEYPDKSTLY
ncbi:InlB B-repeat-containing protein [Pumilibacter muris]|uniref:InlB B-repeat-containing protein n=1 Tax=Pumilibacter muris TaxID=2941510 RepID=UPI00203B4114|nr:InlB B-repeat-containing protein [Pumilibacter muris]